MKSSPLLYIFHFTIYYIAWFFCIIYAANDNAFASTLCLVIAIALQLMLQILRKDVKGLIIFVGTITLLGFLIDTVFLYYNVIVFNANPFVYIDPPWMIALWICFSIFAFSTMKKFMRHYIILGILSAIFFPLAYLFGVQLGAAKFPGGAWNSITVGLAWAILFPFMLNYFAEKYHFG